MALVWPNAAVWAAASVSPQSPQKRKRDSERPERTRRDDDDGDEAFDPGDDSDLGLGVDLDSDDSGESIGLDTSLGFDDGADDIELSDDDDEDEVWSTYAEETGDLPDSDVDIPGEEYGWIDDDEPADDDESFDAGIGDDEVESRDDGGAEGVEDDSELDDLNLSELPELDADSEEDGAPSSGEAFDELGGLALVDEPSIEIAPGEVWKVLPARAVTVTRIAGLTAPVTGMVAHGTGLFLCSDGLQRVRAQSDVLERMPLAAAAPHAPALAEHDGVLYLAVIAAGRVHTWRDDSQTFEQRDTPGVAQAFYTRSSAGLKLWWRTTRGGLGTDGARGSALPGELDAEVLAFHADGKRSLAALCRHRGRLQLLCSSDAGKRFARQPVPALPAEARPSVEVCLGAVLLGADTDVRCAWLPEAFEPVASLARAPAALSDEEDEAYVYACARRGDEWLLIRRAARASRVAPLVLAVLGKELIREPEQLAVGYAEGGALSLYVSGQDTLLRIDASLDSEELA